MRLGALAALVAAVAATVGGVLVGSTPASAAPALCGAGTHGGADYAYAGHQSSVTAHGIRATITPLVEPRVSAGHAAAWIGVGGPGQGPNGTTMWLQAGIAAIPGLPMMLYAEITRGAGTPRFVPLLENVQVGASHRLAVLEVAGRRDHWRVWLDGRPVEDVVHLPGSSKRWRPIATAESWSNGTGACNAFGFRFEQVGVARARGGSWKTFVPGATFLDRGYAVRQLRPTSGGARTLAADRIRPYAFDAVSA